MNKIVIYTAIIGGYDDLIEQPHMRGVDYICFSDSKITRAKNWKIVIVEKEKSKRRLARKLKILSHIYLDKYDYTIWIDSNCLIKSSSFIDFALYALNQSPLWALEHFHNDGILGELKRCERKSKDKKTVMINQINRYLAEGFSEKGGMVATGLLLRNNNNPAVRVFNELWWSELEKGSLRDQLITRTA